jgi:hypothetical protein
MPFTLLSPLLYLLSCIIFGILKKLHNNKKKIFYKVIPIVVILFFVCPIYTGTIPISGDSNHGDLVIKIPGNYGNDEENAVCLGFKGSRMKNSGFYKCYGWKLSFYNPFLNIKYFK